MRTVAPRLTAGSMPSVRYQPVTFTNVWSVNLMFWDQDPRCFVVLTWMPTHGLPSRPASDETTGLPPVLKS